MQPFRLRSPSQAATPPRYPFVGGPVDGARLVVLPHITPDGGVAPGPPPFAVVRHKPEQDFWAVGDLDPETGDPWPQAVYRREDDPTSYRYVRAVPNQYPRITCPLCGKTSNHPGDVADGYCRMCHQKTRGCRFAVIRPRVGGQLPERLDGRWLLRTGTTTLTPETLQLGAATITPTDLYERNTAGAYAQVHYLTPA